MAIFRKIHVTFWEDVFVDSLTPERKTFFLYLLTNSKTTQCGIYEYSVSKMCLETGFNRETVEKLLAYFVEMNKIKLSKENSEIAIKNWGRYNDSTSSKVKACINKELMSVKSEELIDWMGLDPPIGKFCSENYRVGGQRRRDIFARDNNRCLKCNSLENLTIDHVIPRAIGGTEIDENLRTLCRSCNSKRPAIGPELVREVTESGYNYEQLLAACHASSKNRIHRAHQ